MTEMTKAEVTAIGIGVVVYLGCLFTVGLILGPIGSLISLGVAGWMIYKRWPKSATS